jgi:hypothetical protein
VKRFHNDPFKTSPGRFDPLSILSIPAPGPRARLLSLIHPPVRRRQYRQSARCLRAPLDLAIPYQERAVTASSYRHANEHVLAVKGLHHPHALHRQLSFPALGRADREYRSARGEIETGLVPLDSVGFTNVGLLTLPEGNPAGNALAPRPPDLDILEVQTSGRVLFDPAFRGRPYHKLAARSGLRRDRPRLGLARYRYRDLPVIHPHRQVRHQRALDVADHLLGRELGRRQHMDLLDRATLALDDLCGHNSRKREDKLLGSLDGKYAAGNVVQLNLFMREFDAAGNRWPILQTTNL